MQIRVADKLEAQVQEFLNDEYRIDAATVLIVFRLHVPLGVIDDAIEAA